MRLFIWKVHSSLPRGIIVKQRSQLLVSKDSEGKITYYVYGFGLIGQEGLVQQKLHSSFKLEILAPEWLELEHIEEYHLMMVGPVSAKNITDQILLSLIT